MKFIFLILLLSTQVFARWATRADLPYVVLNDESEVTVKKDGTYSIIQIMEFELQNEKAKERFSLFPIPFNSSFNKVTILEATVTNGPTVYPYAKDKVVERSLSKDNGISDSKILQIPLSNIQVGSKIFIKFRMDVSTAIVPGHFSSTFNIGEFSQADNASIKIDSEVPLHVLENDPYKVISVSERKQGIKYHYHVYLSEPYLKLPIEEVGSLPLSKYTFLRFSTDKDWKKITTSMKDRFEKVLTQPLPKEYSGLIQELKKIEKLEDKVNHVIAHVTQKYNYLGDWRTINGGFSPRNLEEIANTKFGDCKDFSVMTTKILRELKIQADVALVFRGIGPQARVISYELPSTDLFNHAIVRIEDSGKTYWVDPTNKISYGLNFRSDISGRSVLPLTNKHALEHIPLNPPEKTFIQIDKVISYENENSGQVKGEMSFAGTYAILFREMGIATETKKMEDAFLKFFSDGEKPIVPDVSGYDSGSRLYSRINLKFDYAASDLSSEEDGKHLGVLPGISPVMNVLAHHVEKWEGDLYIGEEQSLKRTVTIKGIFAARRPRGCDISTSWLDYKRSFEFLADGLRMTEHFHYKTEYIPQEKFKSTDFKLLQSNIFNCVAENHVAFKWDDKKHAESEEEVEKRFMKLPLKERLAARIQYVRDVRSDKVESGFSDADLIYFLKKNIKEQPTDYLPYRLWAGIILDAGYHSGNDYNTANIQAAQKVLTDGLHECPNDVNLLVDYQKTRLYEGERESVFHEMERLSKREVTNVTTLTTMARLYSDLGIPDKTFPLLARALKEAKDNEDKELVWFRLAGAYSASKQPEKCVGAYNQVLKIDPKDAYSHINVIGCLISAKKFDEAVNRAKAGLKVTSAGMMYSNTAYALNHRAYDFHMKNKLTEAERDYKDSLKYRQESGPYSGLAEIAISRGEYDKAITLVNEGVKHHDGNKNDYINYIAKKILKVSPEHFKKLTGSAINESQSVSEKLWGIYSISYSLHKEKKREEMYANVEKGIAIGEQVIQSGRIEGEVAAALGSLYAIYGIDADNEELLNKATLYLGMAQSLIENDQRVSKNLNEVNRIKDNIKNGRIPTAELNYNRKFKNLKYGMTDSAGKGMITVIPLR